MSKNNLIKKSDKKFIRLEKARIRRLVFDFKKQEEMIADLYRRFISGAAKVVAAPSQQDAKEGKKEKPKVKPKSPEKAKKAQKKKKLAKASK